jgi:hypothetical protein
MYLAASLSTIAEQIGEIMKIGEWWKQIGRFFFRLSSS